MYNKKLTEGENLRSEKIAVIGGQVTTLYIRISEIHFK